MDAKWPPRFTQFPSAFVAYAKSPEYLDTNANVKCFKYSGDTAYATNAEGNCVNLGGHLASIHSAEEQNFLMQTFNPSEDVWIGAVDADHDWVWEWTDGSPFDFSYWLSDQPDGGQYYTVMDCDNSASGKWRDLGYNDNDFHYIYQLDL